MITLKRKVIIENMKPPENQKVLILRHLFKLGYNLSPPRVILYEIHDINRFPTVQDFASYARLIKSKPFGQS